MMQSLIVFEELRLLWLRDQGCIMGNGHSRHTTYH